MDRKIKITLVLIMIVLVTSACFCDQWLFDLIASIVEFFYNLHYEDIGRDAWATQRALMTLTP